MENSLKKSQKQSEENLDKREMSEFIASRLMLINPILNELDIDFLKQAGKDMCNQANSIDSAAPLIRNYSPLQSELLQKQGNALILLSNYIEAINECSELKKRIDLEEQHHQKISKMFGL